MYVSISRIFVTDLFCTAATLSSDFYDGCLSTQRWFKSSNVIKLFWAIYSLKRYHLWMVSLGYNHLNNTDFVWLNKKKTLNKAGSFWILHFASYVQTIAITNLNFIITKCTITSRVTPTRARPTPVSQQDGSRSEFMNTEMISRTEIGLGQRSATMFGS